MTDISDKLLFIAGSKNGYSKRGMLCFEDCVECFDINLSSSRPWEQG